MKPRGVVVLFVIVIGWLKLVACYPTLYGSDLSREQIREARELIPYYHKMEKKYNKMGLLALRIEDSVPCFIATKSKKLYRKALELFNSLEDTLGKCDMESYEILAKNYVGNGELYTSFHVVNEYRTKHAHTCRPKYKEQYHELVKEVDTKSLDIIRKTIETLNVDEFLPRERENVLWWWYTTLLTIERPEFMDEKSQPAVKSLAKRVAELIREAYKDNIKGDPESIKSLLDEFLFEPCKKYRAKLADVLTPARFDAMIRDNDQNVFMRGDVEFFQAMINNRLCASLLEEREKLYKPLTDKLDEFL